MAIFVVGVAVGVAGTLGGGVLFVYLRDRKDDIPYGTLMDDDEIFASM